MKDIKLLFIFLLVSFCASNGFCQLVDGENLKRQPYYDSTLNRMRLRDPPSVEKVIGTKENIIDSYNENCKVINADGSQLLIMMFHPGDVVNTFSAFKVERNLKGVKSKYRIGDREFVSGKGIKIGITPQALTKALGTPLEVQKEGAYIKHVYKQSGGLYYGYYWFKYGKLEKFWFGEDYP